MPNGNGNDLPVAGYAYTPQEGWVPVQPSGPAPYIQHPTTPDWVMPHFFGQPSASTTVPEEPSDMQLVHGARQSLTDTPSFTAHLQTPPGARWPTVSMARRPCPDPCEGQDKKRDLTDAEKKALDDLSKKVKERVKIADGYTDHRKDSDAKIDKAIEALRKELECHEAGKLPARLRAVMWGIEQYLNEDVRKEYEYEKRAPKKEGSISAYGEKTWKCNKFVADAYATGAGLGISKEDSEKKGYHANPDGRNNWGPLANSLASPTTKLRNLSKATAVTADACPKIGDIVAYPAGIGHSTLYLGEGLVLNAKGSGIEVGTHDFEHRQHDNKSFFREYTGEGK